MLNRIRQFIESRGMTRYRFWQETGLGRDTAYRLYKDPTYIPTGQVLDKICSTYKMQPGEFLEWRDDSQNQNLAPSATFSETVEQNTLLNKTNSDNEALSPIRLKVVCSKKKAS